jgi:lipoprotein-anchoring transpeptidase ErfK/SrfK
MRPDAPRNHPNPDRRGQPCRGKDDMTTRERSGPGRTGKGTRSGIGVSLLAGVVLVGAAACTSKSPQANSPGPAGTGRSGAASGSSSASASPSAGPSPSGPPMLLDSITPAPGASVGVAMPISIVFTKPVAASARKAIEQHLSVTTSTPVTGAWHWFGGQRVDWRPQGFWKSGTQVTVKADFAGVQDGNGDVGTHAYSHSFTIGADVETTISVTGHSMQVKNGGKVVRNLSIDAGNPKFPTWDGTMAVIDKSRTVHMTSCSAGITCDKSSPDFYDESLPWDVHLTFSGTYVHFSGADPNPGHGFGSHGCVHLSLADATWFYTYSKQGDPVTITGSPRGKADADNGYAAYNLTWPQWLAISATGAQTTKPA